MDDQPRRRRRPQAAQPSTPPEAEAENTSVPAQETAPAQPTRRSAPNASAEGGAPKRRRRSAAASEESDELFWHPESAQLDTQRSAGAPSDGEKTSGPLGWLTSFDALVCRLGDSILYALKWLSIGLMFLLGFLVSGIKKALVALRRTKPRAAKRKAVHKGKRIPRKTPAAPHQPHESHSAANRPHANAPHPKKDAAPQTFTIEPTRPSDYQGMSEHRAGANKHKHSVGKAPHAGASKKKRTVRAPGKSSSLAYSATMAALICVALVSTYMIGSILWRSISTKRLSDSLSARYSELSQTQSGDDEEGIILPTEAPAESTPAPTDAPQDVYMPRTTPTPRPTDAVLNTKFHQLGGDALPEMEALYKDNRDLVGWLRMEGILDLPVVYKDNEYYLTRDFYKNKSASGTLFLDENHPFRENAQNLLLHGHNMKDGTMFGRLVQYETNLQFLKNNPFIQYSTLWKKEQYVICAVLHVSLDVHSEDFFNYFTHHTFSSDAQFESYVRLLQNRSVFSIPVDIEPTDALLTLSTCLDEDRLVIVARRLRPGESKSTLRHQVQLAARQ